jgi:hypothetical protein
MRQFALRRRIQTAEQAAVTLFGGSAERAFGLQRRRKTERDRR